MCTRLCAYLLGTKVVGWRRRVEGDECVLKRGGGEKRLSRGCIEDARYEYSTFRDDGLTIARKCYVMAFLNDQQKDLGILKSVQLF